MKTIKSKIKTILGSCILFVTACPVMGQAGQTPKLTPDTYALWSTLETPSLSEKGNWVSYPLTYESGNDTLFVKNAVTSKTIAFPKGYNGTFNKEEQFSCMLINNSFQQLNLKTGQVHKVEEVQQYDYANNGKLLLLFRNQNNNSFLEIRDQNLNRVRVIDSVSHYSLNPSKTAIACQTVQKGKNAVSYLDLQKEFATFKIIESDSDNFQNFVWHKQGRALVFVNQLVSDKIVYYNAETKNTLIFDTKKVSNWPKDMIINAPINESLGISDDVQTVFFTVKKKVNQTEVKSADKVQVWNAADKDLYEFRERYGDSEFQNRLAAWYPENNRFNMIGSETEPMATLLPNQKKAMLMAPNVYKPESKYTPDADYYLLDLLTGEKTLVLKKNEGDWQNIEFSPKGSYLAYAKEGNWWLYNVVNKTHSNLTKNIKTNFFDEDNDYPEVAQSYGIAAWTNDEKVLLLYDKYDVWEINLLNGTSKRLTDGRVKDIVFRINKQAINHVNTQSFSKPIATVNSEKEIVLDAVTSDFSKSGYGIFQKDKGWKPVVFENKKIDHVIKAENADKYLYVQQKYNEPPSVVLYSKSTEEAKTIFKSNPQHQQYNWGKSEIVEYKNAKGKKLKGVLFYPFNYNPEKQYPMVVQIYQRQLSMLHIFNNPSLLNTDGFNKTNFTSQEYFVLYPDIVYEVGNPGFSAVDCAVAATKAAIAKASVNPKKIGLIGHSFGGYQTNFIITQTDLFAAAISGCGISDLVSCYLSVGWSYAKDETWRFEQEQMRMRKSFYESKEGYQNNSPIYHAEKIKTPLLSWTGGSDLQVDSFHSFEWYAALRKLKKENVFVVYPKEGHVLINESNQKDMTTKAMEWFDYYLKEGEMKEWMISK